MSFPEQNAAWPPKPLTPAFDMIADAAAWWSGDVDHLAGRYRGHMRPAQFNGGIVGTAARMFWGAPPAGGGKKLHIPLAADLAATSATVMFDTPPMIHLATDDGNQVAQDRLDLMFGGDQFAADLLVGAESCAALGGVYGRVTWDTSISDTPWIAFVDADSAIPEFKWGRLTAATFVEELSKINKHTHRLLTRYLPGRVEYQLREGADNNLGRTVHLKEHPATEQLAEVVDQYAGITTGGTMLPACYIPNALPVPQFRRDGQLRHLGRPDLSADLHPLFDFLDETWTSLQRDLRIGKGRMVLPEYMLRDRGRLGEGPAFAVEQEFYTTVNARPDEGVKPEFVQGDIRVQAHLDTAEGIIRQVLQRANYSPRTFGLTAGGGGQTTAREIEADTEATRQTWKAKSRYWRAGLAHLAAAAVEIDDALNDTGAIIGEPLAVDMAPPVQETMLDKAQTLQALDAARAISTGEKVATLHPDWDQLRQDRETQAILREQGTVGDPVGALGPDQWLNQEPTVEVGGQPEPADVKTMADAMGTMIRAGVDPKDAARIAGLDGVTFTGGRPVTLRWDDNNE